MSHRFTTRLEEDDFGDLILTIPYEVCEELGWDIGTDLDYELTEDGTAFTLKKAKKMSEELVKVSAEEIAESLVAVNKCLIAIGERLEAVEKYV